MYWANTRVRSRLPWFSSYSIFLWISFNHSALITGSVGNLWKVKGLSNWTTFLPSRFCFSGVRTANNCTDVHDKQNYQHQNSNCWKCAYVRIQTLEYDYRVLLTSHLSKTIAYSRHYMYICTCTFTYVVHMYTAKTNVKAKCFRGVHSGEKWEQNKRNSNDGRLDRKTP